jgi:hypothetical protein
MERSTHFFSDIIAAAMPMPLEGSEARAALAANAAKQVTRFNKIFKQTKRKPPINISKSPNGVLRGKLITHENDMYVMSLGMMLGLRVSLYYNAGNLIEEISDQDMKSGVHYVFPPEGSQKAGLPHTPKHLLSHTFKFKDYAPKVFHSLRMLAGINTKKYMDSVSGDSNFIEFSANSKR